MEPNPPLIGFLANLKKGFPPSKDFLRFRIAAMDEALRALGAKLVVYNPRQIDPSTGTVDGLVVEDGMYAPVKVPVPLVNGSWFIGRDRSYAPKLSAAEYRVWIAENGIDVYPQREFSHILKDKYKTARLVQNFDPSLQPKTEAYDHSLEQLTRFVERYKSVFVKPRFGSKGDGVFSIRRVRDGFRCAYYTDKQKREVTHPSVAEVRDALKSTVGSRRFVIQQGIAIDKHEDAPFDFRVIMLDDGMEWHWVHKAVLAAPGSEIANTTQGGTNWSTLELLDILYGETKAQEIFEEMRRVSFECVRHLDTLFPGKLMEVAFDFVLNKKHQLKIIEINTLPGMTKPGLPPEPAFHDILNRRPAEREIYEKFVLPHGSHLARFLFSKLEERQALATRGESHGVVRHAHADAGSAPPAVSIEIPFVEASAPRLHRAIAQQASYLARSCISDGSFRQREDLVPGAQVEPRFDTLWHVGAIRALDQFDRWRPTARVAEVMRRAGELLKARYLAPIPGEDHLLGIWSCSEFNYSGKPDQVRLGWVGLGLSALLCVERRHPGLTSLEELRSLGRFLCWAQNPNGSFRSLFVPSEGGWQPRWKSLDYPGEAAYGLLRLNEVDPSHKWVQAAADAIAHVVRKRENADGVPADWWSLVATARLLPVYHECEPRVSRDAVIQHARKVCEHILAMQVRNVAVPAFDGSFGRGGQTEPTATCLQGLLAARTFMEEDVPELAARLEPAIKDGVDFLVRACMRDEAQIAAMPRALRPTRYAASGEAMPPRGRGREIRIDYVQHGLAAMLGGAQSSESASPDRAE